jgi:YVTN family beta-propeller protein
MIHFDPIRAHRSFGVPDRYEFVTNGRADYMNVFDLAARRCIARLRVGRQPDVTATTADGRYLYVASAEHLAIVDIDSLEIIRTLVGNGIGHNYALNLFPDGERMFLFQAGGSIVVLAEAHDPRRVRAERVIRVNPPALPDSAVGGKGHFTADGRYYINANWHTDAIFALDLAHNFALIPLVSTIVSRPDDLVMTANDRYAYIASHGRSGFTGAVHVMELERAGDSISGHIVDTITVGRNPAGATMSPDSRTVYVTNVPEGSVSAIDTATNTVAFTVSAAACYVEADITDNHKDIEGVTVSADGRTLYAYSVRYGGLVIIDDLGGKNRPSYIAGPNPVNPVNPVQSTER